jgi:Uma2 family endonuclease
MATIPHLLTYEEMLRLPRDVDGAPDGKEEVVRGELRRLPPNDYPHAEIIQRLITAWVTQVDPKKIAILGSNFGLLIRREPVTCRIPDLALYWRDRIVIQDGLYHSAPGLVAEILSPSETRRRKEEKMEDYASIGIAEAWLVSPEAQSVEIRRLDEGKLVTTGIVVGGMLQPMGFPEIAIPVSDIWPE